MRQCGASTLLFRCTRSDRTLRGTQAYRENLAHSRKLASIFTGKNMHSLKSGVMLATCFCFVVSVSSAVLSQDVQSGGANAVERTAITRSVDTHAHAELP